MNSKNNGKEEKSKGSGNPVLDALTEMLSVMSPEEKMQLMANLENIAQSGSLSAACRYWDGLRMC